MRKITLSLLLTMLIMVQFVEAQSPTTEPFYAYNKATYRIENVKTDGRHNTYAPWYKKVYKYNYDLREEIKKHHEQSNFNVSQDTPNGVVVWSKRVSGWHITHVDSDIDTMRAPQWDRYKQPKVEYRCNGKYLFTAQERAEDVHVNGFWDGDAYCDGLLEVYSHGYGGEGRNKTFMGGNNRIKYYTQTVETSHKVSDWVFHYTDIPNYTSIGSIVDEGYVLPTWDGPYGWRSVTPYQASVDIKPVKMDVRYYANGGTGDMNLNRYASTNLSRNTYTRKGWKFKGWNTQANGYGQNIVDGGSVMQLQPTPNMVYHLHAQWEDSAPPTITVVRWEPPQYKPDGNLNWTNKDVQLRFRIYDEGGLDRINYSYGSQVYTKYCYGQSDVYLDVPWTQNAYGLKVEAYDIAGNRAIYNYDIKNIDKQAPVIRLKSYTPERMKFGELNWTNTDVVLEHSISENSSGLKRAYIERNGAMIKELALFNGQLSATTRFVAEQNMQGYNLVAEDRAGNISRYPIVVDNIDKVPPNITGVLTGICQGNNFTVFDENTPIRIQVKDDLSGISSWKYKLDYKKDGVDYSTGYIPVSGTNYQDVYLPTGTKVVISVIVYDKAGNQKTVQSCEYNPLFQVGEYVDSEMALVDYDYVFSIYNKQYGTGETKAYYFVEAIKKDEHEASKSAYNYIKQQMDGGLSRYEAVQKFLDVFMYNQY